DSELVLERFEMNVRRAKIDGIAQKLVNEPNNRRVLGGGIEVRVVRLSGIDHFEALFLRERIDRVRSDTEPLLHLALNRFARCQNRFELQPRDRFQRVQPLRGKQPAGGDFYRAVGASQWEKFFLE